MSPTEVVVALVAGVPTAGAALAAGTRFAFKFLVVDRVKAAEADAARERADRLASEARLVAELEAARAAAAEFKSERNEVQADLRRARRVIEMLRGMPVSAAPPAEPSARDTLAGYELRQEDRAFVDEMERLAAEREIPTARVNPTPKPGPLLLPTGHRSDPDQTPRRQPWPSVRAEDNRAARDPSDGRAVPKPRRRG